MVVVSLCYFENRKSQLVVHDLHSGKRRVVASFEGHNGAPSFLLTVLDWLLLPLKNGIEYLRNEFSWWADNTVNSQ